MADERRGVFARLRSAIPLFGSRARQQRQAYTHPEKGELDVHIPKNVRYNQYASGSFMFPHRIKYKGVFDLDGLYKTMALWFKNRRFELHESLFKKKPPELEVRWRAERNRTSYVRELITVEMHMWGEYDIPVMVKGKKKRMTNARMVITINGGNQLPYPDIFGQPRWTNTNFERRVLNVFNNWVMAREIGGLYEDRLYYELYDLYGTVKGFLQFGAR